jgi:hypothetical protein
MPPNAAIIDRIGREQNAKRPDRSVSGDKPSLAFSIAMRGFDDLARLQTTAADFDGAGVAADKGANFLNVGHEPAARHGGDVLTNAALALGFAATPDDVAIDGTFAADFTNSCHSFS